MAAPLSTGLHPEASHVASTTLPNFYLCKCVLDLDLGHPPLCSVGGLGPVSARGDFEQGEPEAEVTCRVQFRVNIRGRLTASRIGAHKGQQLSEARVDPRLTCDFGLWPSPTT